RAPKRLEYVRLFQLVQVGRDVDPLVGKLHGFRHAIRVVVADLFRQPFGFDGVGAFERDGAFDRVFKLADVAGPGVSLEQTHRAFADAQGATTRRAELLDEVRSEIRDVFRTFTQRW